MKLKDKLQMLMARHSLNGQKLARLSQVSDSEISRILQGKSRPGLDNAFRLAKSVGVTLDYLADDGLDIEASSRRTTSRPRSARSSTSSRKSALAGHHDPREHRFLGYEVAMSRLVGGKPIIEIDKEPADLALQLPPASPHPRRAPTHQLRPA